MERGECEIESARARGNDVQKYLWICNGVRSTNFVCFYLLVFFDLYNSTCIMWICSHCGFSNKPRVKQGKKTHTQIDIEEERKKRSQFEEKTTKKKHSEWTHTDALRNKNVNDFLPLLFLISAFHQSFCIWKGKKKSEENTERCYAHISCGYVCMYEWLRKYKSLYWVCH